MASGGGAAVDLATAFQATGGKSVPSDTLEHTCNLRIQVCGRTQAARNARAFGGGGKLTIHWVPRADGSIAPAVPVLMHHVDRGAEN